MNRDDMKFIFWMFAIGMLYATWCFALLSIKMNGIQQQIEAIATVVAGG